MVSAKRPAVDLELTEHPVQPVERGDQALPVQELEDIVNLQAGVVDGHFRGGRLGEVQYQVDGVSVNNAYDNSVEPALDRSLLEEVQVISGTFDAEYGQAMSGVVNAVLKDGHRGLRVVGEAFFGGFVFPGNESRRRRLGVRIRASTQNYQATVSGPLTGCRRRAFLLSGAAIPVDDDVIPRAPGASCPPTSRTSSTKIWSCPPATARTVPLGYSASGRALAKLTTLLAPEIEAELPGPVRSDRAAAPTTTPSASIPTG